MEDRFGIQCMCCITSPCNINTKHVYIVEVEENIPRFVKSFLWIIRNIIYVLNEIIISYITQIKINILFYLLILVYIFMVH